MTKNKKKGAFQEFLNEARWPFWLNRRTLILLIIALLFLGALSLAEPLPRADKYSYANLTPTPSAEFLEAGLPTLLPQEYLENAEQTNGILLGGTILVLIVVLGTLSALRRQA
jgi:hypothetical protein